MRTNKQTIALLSMSTVPKVVTAKKQKFSEKRKMCRDETRYETIVTKRRLRFEK